MSVSQRNPIVQGRVNASPKPSWRHRFPRDRCKACPCAGMCIRADDPGLYEAAALLGLGFEDDHGRPAATTLQMVSRQVPLRHPPDERQR
jgi:hypothetical protein